MPALASAEELVVPPGTRVLHIGPPKTGTTALQGAFWLARESMLEQGVRYPGNARHPVRPMLAVTRRSLPGAAGPPPMRAWDRFLADVRRDPEARVMISSEGFAYASAEAIGRIVTDLEPDRLHVVVTLRPLGRLLASEWQQQMQSGLRLDFEAWLTMMFGDPSSKSATSFWYRHRHDELVGRWVEAAGPGRVTVLVVDDRDHGRLYRDMEVLLGLRAGTLVPEASLANRSLTLEEVSALRAVQEQFAADGRTARDFDRFARLEVGPFLKARVPDPSEHRIETPRWALARADATSASMIPAIAATGARWWGDLDRLAVPQPDGAPEHVSSDVPVPPVVAAALAVAVGRASGLLAPTSGQPAAAVPASAPPARGAGGAALAGAARRMRRATRTAKHLRSRAMRRLGRRRSS